MALDPLNDTSMQSMDNTKEVTVDVIQSSNEPEAEVSSSLPKRACFAPTCEEPSSKRSKASTSTTSTKSDQALAPTLCMPPDKSATAHDKETWQGFCEIESDPAYFSVILREMGVRGVTVREVFTMDPVYLQESLPQPIHGLILLFNYREFGTLDQPSECPANVWFANQLPAQNSCATLAMLNILMNSSSVSVGEQLSQFKSFTQDLSPYQRGEALASFDFVKRIHNSFAKKMDMLESDKLLSYKVKKSQVKQTKQAGKQRSTKSRRASAGSVVTDESAEDCEDTGHHFIAFVPVASEVWKLDGLDAQPTSMGQFDEEKGETWLGAVSETIGALMAAGDDEYGVIALTHAPLVALREKACRAVNTMKCVEARLDRVEKDWRSFVVEQEEALNPIMLGIEDEVLSHPVSDDVTAQIDSEGVPGLLNRRSCLATDLSQLAAGIVAEIQQEAEEDQKAAQRRYDCGPVIKKWLEMLAENGHLEEHLERFMPATKKKKSGI